MRRLPGNRNKNTRLSDHIFLKCNLNLIKLKRGTGYWKLNAQHLKNDDYKQGIIDIFKNIGDWQDPILKLEAFKISVHE